VARLVDRSASGVDAKYVYDVHGEAVRKAGGNPFTDYQLPEAVIRFKQGFGRLIRSRSDCGFVVVLDHRIARADSDRAGQRRPPRVCHALFRDRSA